MLPSAKSDAYASIINGFYGSIWARIGVDVKASVRSRKALSALIVQTNDCFFLVWEAK